MKVNFMKPISGAIIMILFILGCSSTRPDNKKQNIKEGRVASAFGYGFIETRKEDRNTDGQIDSIFFTYKGCCDRDYGFLDKNFDGFFELKIIYGEGYWEKTLSLPLTLEEIEKNHPEK
jgi:hypothetical protein